MYRYLLKRTLLALSVALVVSFISFALMVKSGDMAKAIAGFGASAEDVEIIRAKYGLGRPVVIQYIDWMGSLFSGDLGKSIFSGQLVGEAILSRLPITALLASCALIFSLFIAVPLGVLAAAKKNTWIDRACLLIAVSGQAIPSFWLGLLLILLLGVYARILPISGTETWLHFVMPTLTLAYYCMPSLMRITRSGMIEVLEADYIRTAKAKGAPDIRTMFIHALPNAILPLISAAAVQLGFMLGGSVVIESVFNLNGIGLLAWNSIKRSDFPVVQAIVLIVSMIFVLLTLLADFLNVVIDPRLRKK